MRISFSAAFALTSLFTALTAHTLGCSKTELAPPEKASPESASNSSAKAALDNGPSTAPAMTAPKPESETCGKSKVVKTYGAKLSGTDIVAVDKVLDDPDKFAGDKPILVQGRVRSACSRKGCWMELAPSMEKDAAGSRVTFKDYGFFVPTTSAGKTACVEGLVSTRRIAPEEVAHMESEGAHFAKKMSDGSAREVRIVASGVELFDAS